MLIFSVFLFRTVILYHNTMIIQGIIFTEPGFQILQYQFYSNSLFSSHTLAWICSLWFNLFDKIVFLITQPCLTMFQ